MSDSKGQTFKKPYEKPRVTSVRLSVENNVLQGCRGGFANMSGYDEWLCYETGACEKLPTL